MTSILWIEQSEKDVENTQISLPHPFHNFKGDYIIKCSKLNKYWEDDGGCFSVVTNVPGTCLACRQDEIPKELNYNISYADWLLRHHYDYKWCAYMPDINSGRMSENPIAPSL